MQPAQPAAKKNNFRVTTKSLFLTYPQCDFPLEDFRDQINLFFGDNIEKGVCCQEQHQDGNLHLHAAIVLHHQYSTRVVTAFDELVSPAKHPNIQSKFSKGQKGAFSYVAKKGNYLALPSEEVFDVKEFLSLAARKQSTTPSLMISRLRESTTTTTEVTRTDLLMQEFPEYMLRNARSVSFFLQSLTSMEQRSSRAQASQIPVHVRPADSHSTTWNIAIADWINLRIRRPTPERRFPQLWIKAASLTGKTELIRILEQAFQLRVYWWPKDEKWMDGYEDDRYELIVLDEYRSQKKVTELNPILSNDTVPLSRRGREPTLKRDILPMIITSNFTPQEAYYKLAAHQPERLAPLLSRLLVVEVPEGGLVRVIPTAPHVGFPLAETPEPDDDYDWIPDVQDEAPQEPIPYSLALESSDEELVDEQVFMRRHWYQQDKAASD